jgi:hypothetical protein
MPLNDSNDVLQSLQKRSSNTQAHQSINGSKTKIESKVKGRNGVMLAPLGAIRDTIGATPGTANTHGGPQRQNYK